MSTPSVEHTHAGRARQLEYIVMSRAHVGVGRPAGKGVFANEVEAVMFGANLNGNPVWRADFSWWLSVDGDSACRLEAWNEAWAGLRASGALEILDRDPSTVSVHDICAALENLGFRDVTTDPPEDYEP